MTVLIVLAVVLYLLVGVFLMRRVMRPVDALDGAITLAAAPIWPLYALGSLIAK